jgi:hypothetical protein
MSDVIAHSPMRHERGTFPHRIVIRDQGDQFVVHAEVHQPGKAPWYFAGDYFRKPEGDPEAALHRAWRKFELRCRTALGIPQESDEPEAVAVS